SIDGKGDEDAVGNRVRVKVVKNKVAPPFRKTELDIYFGKGINKYASLLDSAVKHGIIDKRGAWFTQGETKIGQGHENAVNFVESNPEYAENLENQLREMLFPGQVLKDKDGNPVNKTQKKTVKAKEAETPSPDVQTASAEVKA
ncbi:MAG: recombinase RecA, partial [Treponema sp.]|nr:recombinase RecA [Treponema sp.]